MTNSPYVEGFSKTAAEYGIDPLVLAQLYQHQGGVRLNPYGFKWKPGLSHDAPYKDDRRMYNIDFSGNGYSGFPRGPINVRLRDYGPKLSFGYKDMEDAYGTRYGIYGSTVGALTGGIIGSRKRTLPLDALRIAAAKHGHPIKARSLLKARSVLGLAGMLAGSAIGGRIGRSFGKFDANWDGYKKIRQAANEGLA